MNEYVCSNGISQLVFSRPITYDASGNPTSYKSFTLTWEGRQLASYGPYSYEYDENGLRTGKSQGSTEYYYNGTLLMGMVSGGNTLLFSYDASGSVVSVNFNGTEYYYIKNAQSDIIGIANTDGIVVVTYNYDAWGKPTTAGSMSSTLGAYNPFRYRGYVYDTETGFYYLQSRYYDPSYGRFISPDVFVSTGQGVLGNNMYAYCGNNPINRCDLGGHSWEESIEGILHAANNFALAIGIDTAEIFAPLLMMEQDNNGVYHAKFDCWQQYLGYNGLYDIAFDLGTSMDSAVFPFTYNGSGYTIWAWKGDYINLGAGAELGIYRGSSGHRTVDKSLAIQMNMTLFHNGDEVMSYSPNEAQWWITGFVPVLQNVNANELTAVYGLTFSDANMYRAFKSGWEGDSRWTFYDESNNAVLQF